MMDEMLKCPECGAALMRELEIKVILPATGLRKITKRLIQSRDVQIIATYWSEAFLVCPGCGRYTREWKY